MSTTAKDYVAVAAILADARYRIDTGYHTDPHVIVSSIENDLARYFHKSNPRFQRDRFHAAALGNTQ